jgi:hypothetical protein
MRLPSVRLVRWSTVVCALAIVSGYLVPAAEAVPPDRALAQALISPADPIDPVLAALFDERLVRDVAAPVPGTVVLPAVRYGFALTGDQLAKLDITGTPEAVLEVEQFVARLGGRGIDQSGDTFTVYTLPPVQEAIDSAASLGTDGDGPLDSVLVVPTGTKVVLAGAVFEEGQLHAKTLLESTGEEAPGHRSGIHAMAAPSDSQGFRRAGGIGCSERKQNNTAWYDPCHEFFVQENDGDPNAQYWASELKGTGKGKSVWTLNGLEVSSRPKEGSARQQWVDWDPGADAKTNCRSQTISVSYAGAGIAFDKQHCELWDIDKDADGADFANWWRGHVRRQERETGAMTLTKLDNGATPVLLVGFDYYANP